MRKHWPDSRASRSGALTSGSRKLPKSVCSSNSRSPQCSAALDALRRCPSTLYLTINVSPVTVATSGFPALARAGGCRARRRRDHRARADRRLRRAERVARDAARFRRAVAVDDAGAGFASLRHILRLAPEFIKLDRTLIDGIEADGSRQALAGGSSPSQRTSARRSSRRASSASKKSRSSRISACPSDRASTSRGPRRSRLRWEPAGPWQRHRKRSVDAMRHDSRREGRRDRRTRPDRGGQSPGQSVHSPP